MNIELVKEIKKWSLSKNFRDGSPYQSLSVAQIISLSKTFETSGKQIEIEALEQGIVPERYSRNMKTFSPEQQATLLKSTVSVVGLGGLGGGVTEIIARIGIGSLRLIDGDMIEDSNLNRQFFCTQDDIAKSKAETARVGVKKINSSIEVSAFDEYLDDDNGIRLLKGSEVTVDCLDNLKTRFALERVSKKIGSPFVSAAVAGISGHITTIFPEDEGLSLIYGKEESAPERGAEALLGALPHCVTTIAALQASEVIKILLEQGDIFRNRLLTIDLLDNTFEVMQLSND